MMKNLMHWAFIAWNDEEWNGWSHGVNCMMRNGMADHMGFIAWDDEQSHALSLQQYNLSVLSSDIYHLPANYST
jgi:hypothetical protein